MSPSLSLMVSTRHLPERVSVGNAVFVVKKRLALVVTEYLFLATVGVPR
jgi:hypothetical protein